MHSDVLSTIRLHALSKSPLSVDDEKPVAPLKCGKDHQQQSGEGNIAGVDYSIRVRVLTTIDDQGVVVANAPTITWMNHSHPSCPRVPLHAHSCTC